jgi:hypothetical protein
MSGYVQALLINYPSITAVKTENMQGFYTPKDFTKFPSHTSSPNLMSGQGWDGIGMGLELTFLPPVSLKTQSLPAPTMSPYSDKPFQTWLLLRVKNKLYKTPSKPQHQTHLSFFL